MKQKITCFFCLLSFCSFSQDKDEIRFKNIRVEYLNIHSKSGEVKPDIRFSQIYVYDCRPDSTNIGLLHTSNPSLTVLKVRGRLSEEIKRAFELLISSPQVTKNWGELHCFIKRFTLSDFISVPLGTDEQKQTARKYDWAEKSGLKIKFEFYIKRGNDFIPAYRFDTSWTGDKVIIREGNSYLADALAASLVKTSSIDWEKIFSNGKKLSWNDILEFNDQRDDFPILGTQPNKGVYLTFEDFRNNKVTYTDFKVSYDNKGDFLYLKNNSNEETLFTDLWGYSDGKDIFIYSANNFFKLYRIGDSFKIFGAKDYTRSRILALNARFVDLINPNSNFSKANTRARYELNKDFLQIDLDTGELY